METFIIRVLTDYKEVDFENHFDTAKEAWANAWQIKAALPEAWEVQITIDKEGQEMQVGILRGDGEEFYF